MWMICRKEWQQFFSSLTGYIVLGIFLLLTGLLLFVLPDTSLLEFGYAQLDGFFSLMPWLLLFLIPAIAMRSIAEEVRQGTIETLLTLPITHHKIVLGKYAGILLIIICALAPTLLYALSMQALSATGGIDIGATIGSYCSLFLLAALYAAISIYASALVKNPMAAFGVAAFMCIALYGGFDAISKLDLFSGGLDYYIQLFGIKQHTANMSRGVIDAADVMYFVGVTAFFLYLTGDQLQQLGTKK